jgi:hypothetical protein
MGQRQSRRTGQQEGRDNTLARRWQQAKPLVSFEGGAASASSSSREEEETVLAAVRTVTAVLRGPPRSAATLRPCSTDVTVTNIAHWGAARVWLVQGPRDAELEYWTQDAPRRTLVLGGPDLPALAPDAVAAIMEAVESETWLANQTTSS